jgi:hypothetical protein
VPSDVGVIEDEEEEGGRGEEGVDKDLRAQSGMFSMGGVVDLGRRPSLDRTVSCSGESGLGEDEPRGSDAIRV